MVRKGVPSGLAVPLETRFWSRVEKTDSCWLWKGQKSPLGYGKIGEGGTSPRNILAHRLSWEYANGPIADGLCVLHKCDNPPCVNPDHLFLGTMTDNMADKVSKNRQVKGESAGCVALTEDQVRAIRHRYANRKLVNKRTAKGDPDAITAIAADYGVHFVTIFDLVKRRTWAHVA